MRAPSPLPFLSGLAVSAIPSHHTPSTRFREGTILAVQQTLWTPGDFGFRSSRFHFISAFHNAKKESTLFRC